MAKSKFTDYYQELMEVTTKEPQFHATGSIILDAVLSNGRGLPEGQFIELASESGAGKSTMCLHIARQYCSQGRRVVYIDTESGLNSSQIDCFGMRDYVKQMLFIPVRMQTYGEVDNFLSKIVDDPDVQLIIYDSITATIPGRVVDKNVEDMNEPGVAARLQSTFMQKFKAMYQNTNKTIIFINQLRTKIAMGWGQATKVTQAGGQAIGYYMDVRLMMKKVTILEQSLAGYEKPVPYGCDLAIWADKNRNVRPLLKKVITIHFGKGISNAGAIRALLDFHHIIEYIPRKPCNVKFKGEIVQVKKDELEGFIKDNLDYFLELADTLGGLALIQESDDEVVQEEESLEFVSADYINE